jgi:hypothetical protein
MSDRIRLDNYDAAVAEEPLEKPAPEEAAPPEPQQPPEEPPAATTEEPAAEKPAAPTPEQQRIDRLTREKYEAQRQRDEYAAILAAQQRAQQNQQNVQYGQPDPIEAARQQGLQQAREEAVAARFNADCNTLFEKGQSEYGDMTDAVSALNAVGYGARPDALMALTRLPDGHRIYRELAGDLDNAARILNLEPMAMAMEFARMSRGEAPAGNGAAAPVTRAPPPVRPVGGNAARAAKPLDKMSMAEFIRERDRTERRSRILR